MTDDTQSRHPFLDDLTPDAELRSTILRRPVTGPENIRKVVEAVGSFYRSQTPTFFGSIGTRSLLQYEAALIDGLSVQGTAVIERDAAGAVPRVAVTFSPLDGALSLANQLAAKLAPELGEELFI